MSESHLKGARIEVIFPTRTKVHLSCLGVGYSWRLLDQDGHIIKEGRGRNKTEANTKAAAARTVYIDRQMAARAAYKKKITVTAPMHPVTNIGRRRSNFNRY